MATIKARTQANGAIHYTAIVRIRMVAIMDFAIASARRQAEICRLEWRDNDSAGRTSLVRDAKHPTAREGITSGSSTRPKPGSLSRSSRASDYVFPYEPKSVGSAFTRACRVQRLHDLRFHDLRHEATSRLFERGYQIHEVAQFTLHESWNERRTSRSCSGTRLLPA